MERCSNDNVRFSRPSITSNAVYLDGKPLLRRLVLPNPSGVESTIMTAFSTNCSRLLRGIDLNQRDQTSKRWKRCSTASTHSTQRRKETKSMRRKKKVQGRSPNLAGEDSCKYMIARGCGHPKTLSPPVRITKKVNEGCRGRMLAWVIGYCRMT